MVSKTAAPAAPVESSNTGRPPVPPSRAFPGTAGCPRREGSISTAMRLVFAAVLLAALAALGAEYEGRGIELKEVASGFRIQVREAVAGPVSRLWQERRPARGAACQTARSWRIDATHR